MFQNLQSFKTILIELMEELAGSSSGTKIGIIEDVTIRNQFEDWEAFCEFLRNRQSPCLISECTAGDAVEFFRLFPSYKIEAVVNSLSAEIDGNRKENTFKSPMVRTFLKDLLGEHTSERERGEKKLSTNSGREEYKSEFTVDKENFFEQCLTASDVSNLNLFLIIANKDVQKYFPLADVLRGPKRLRFEDKDEAGNLWMFKYSNLRQSYVLTKGWSSYVEDKQLGAGDFVFFQRHLTDRSRLFIGYRRRDGGTAPRIDSHEKTRRKLPKLMGKIKEAETPLQLRLAEHNVSVVIDPVFVIFCGDNQEPEEAYFISYILNELRLRGFAPLIYELTKSVMSRNPEMLYKSRVGIIIFSMNYALSRECLDGFLAVMDHMKANNLVLIPLFYKVSLSEVRDQSGFFEKAFSRLGHSVQASQVLKWRAAMIEVASINTYQYTKGDEVMLAKNIVRDVFFMCNSGRNFNKRSRLQLKSILSLLKCSQSSSPHIIGLWGMAGIGKTTISREIFKTQGERYDICYFLPDFHLMCQTKGLSYLRDEFFSKIFGEEKVFIDAYDTNIRFRRDRFRDIRFLIVLDGVSNARDAELLVGGFDWFSAGHTIILTSRNRQVLLQCNAKEIYRIQNLSKSESLHLFCKFAIGWKGSIPLISELVNYASGNPLALHVLGSFVQQQCIDDEEQHLSRLRQYPLIEIYDAFRRSFNGLDDNEKNTFLDLACFFRGENKDHVVNILDACGFFTDLGIYGLIDESLISLVANRIEMPNIFQDTCRFVVSQEFKEAGKRSRLWESSDIVDVLKNNSGTGAIEGIFLDASGLTFELSPTVFEKMYRLRLLKLYCPTSENHCKVSLPQGLYSLPDELRLLHWERYPLGSLPRTFNPKNLVELNMPYSKMTKLWKGTKNLEKLKRIVLTHSVKFTRFPKLSKAWNLEHIDLEGCTSLVKVNSSILHHHKLIFLSLKGCSNLRILPSTVHLESLVVLNLSGCSGLADLQDFSPNLKELYLAGTSIREMPSSIKDLTRLVTLDLENCKRLQDLPLGISNLKAMVTLKLFGCSNLKSLPTLDALFLRDSQRLNRKITMEESEPSKLHSAIQKSRLDGIIQKSWPCVRITSMPSSILHSLASRLYSLVSLSLCNSCLMDIPEELCRLASVKELDLGGNSFSQIPETIMELCKLHSLRLRHCGKLRVLPELPRSLEILNVHGCVSLKSFPSSFEQFPRHYTFSNCFALSPEVIRKYMRKALDSVEIMAKGHRQKHINAPAFSICIPASAGHKSIVNMQVGSSVRIELTPGIRETLLGFAFSVVVEFRDNYCNAAGFGIKIRTNFSRRLERIFQFWAPLETPTVVKDHMFLFGYVKTDPAEGADHDVLSDFVTFEFHPVNAENQLLDDSCIVKRCGVYLITETKCDALSAKRSATFMDSREHMAPSYQRRRLKGVIETVILNVRKRKRETSVSTLKTRSTVHFRSVSACLEHEQNEGKMLSSHKFLRIETAPSRLSSSQTESPTSICKPALSTTRIHQVSRAHKLIKDFGGCKFGVSVSGIYPNTYMPGLSYSYVSDHNAAIRIQSSFRAYKCRKERLFTRQRTILIQARWRGYQARKNYRTLVMSMGILE